MSHKEDSEDKEPKEKRTGGNIVLCKVAARNLKKTTMKDIKKTESEIAEACIIFHKRHEEKTGKRTKTINEFEKVTRDFSKLTTHEIDKLIKKM